MLEAHAGADVGVDSVGAGDSGDGVVDQHDVGPGNVGDGAGLRDDVGFGRVVFRRADGAVRAQQRRGQHERVADVVAVADVGEVEAAQVAEALFEGHEVGNGLAGMLEVAEGVDDGDARVLRHFCDGLVGVSAQHDDLDPALDVARDVGQGFALAEGRLGLVDEERGAAEGVHRRLEGEARAQGGLLEEHDHLLRVERPAIRGGVGLDVVGEREHAGQLGGGEVGDGAEIATGERNVGGGLRACGFEFLHSSGLSCQFSFLRGVGSRRRAPAVRSGFRQERQGPGRCVLFRRCKAAGSAKRFRWCG